ncbi:hypothetical protein D3C75_1175930 [compost metagenome]
MVNTIMIIRKDLPFRCSLVSGYAAQMLMVMLIMVNETAKRMVSPMDHSIRESRKTTL